MTTNQLALENQLCFSLYRASRLVTRTYHNLLEKLNLTYPQYLVMLVLWEKEEVGMKELAARLDLDSGTLTPLIKRLTSLGLLTKSRDPQDERRAVLALTPEGKKLREKAQSIPQEIYSICATEGVDLHQLKVELDRISEQLAG